MKNTKDLFKFTLQLMRKLDTGKIDVETAKAQAGLLNQTNRMLKYELDKAVAKQKFEGIQIEEL